jgi:hypothetical protein
MINLASGVTVDINIFFLVLRILLLILGVLYFIFSVVIVRQVSLMTESLQTEINPVLSVFAIAYAVVSLGVVLIFIKLL